MTYYPRKTTIPPGEAARRRSKLASRAAPTILEDRQRFWVYCRRVSYAAKNRAIKQNVPCDIDFDYVDRLFVAQNWRCAVSGIQFHVPRERYQVRDPFAPSLDRIEPKRGYVHGNVRLVCNIVNFAINEWGEAALWRLVEAMSAPGHSPMSKLPFAITDELSKRA